MISRRQVLKSVKVISDDCKEQPTCQNCIFRRYGAENWNCHIDAFDLRDVCSNIEAKKKNRGYL